MARGKKKRHGGKKKKAKAAPAAPSSPAAADISSVERGNGQALTAEQRRVASVRAVTGVVDHVSGRDVKFSSFSLMVGGNQLVTDCSIELNQGCRYGLVGTNGSGKSNVLAAIAQGDLEMPEHIDLYHLHEEAPATEQTGVEAVIAHIREEAAKLEALSERIIEEAGPEDERWSRFLIASTSETRPALNRARASSFRAWLLRRPRPDGPQDQAHVWRVAHARVPRQSPFRGALRAAPRRAYQPP